MATRRLAPQKRRADDRPAHLALSPTAVKIGKPHSHWGRASLATFWASPTHNQLRNQLCIGNEGVNLHKKDGAAHKGLHLLCSAGTTPKDSRSNDVYSDCLLRYLCAPPQNNRRGTCEMSGCHETRHSHAQAGRQCQHIRKAFSEQLASGEGLWRHPGCPSQQVQTELDASAPGR